jgi:two-component system CheB/CheR fusion protein
MQVNRIDELKGYYDIVRDNPDEVQALLSDLLISVTNFFRDKEAFENACQDDTPDFCGQSSRPTSARLDRRLRHWRRGLLIPLPELIESARLR